MQATAKIDAFGLKALADSTGRSLSIIYRWRKALLAGEPIGTRAMRELIAATADSPYALTWGDFEPAEIVAVAA